MQRIEYIALARELARDLRHFHAQFQQQSLDCLSREDFWNALQPEPELASRFRDLLDNLYFDGIRSQFFLQFDADKLIGPVADEIAQRLELLADDIESAASRRGNPLMPAGSDC